MSVGEAANLDLNALGVHFNYTAEDVDYDTWYGAWPKRLARTHTLPELVSELTGANTAAAKAARAHDRAIRRTTGMQSQSAARAHARNATAAAGDYGIALRGAIEIHVLFPQHAKGGSDSS